MPSSALEWQPSSSRYGNLNSDPINSCPASNLAQMARQTVVGKTHAHTSQTFDNYACACVCVCVMDDNFDSVLAVCCQVAARRRPQIKRLLALHKA